MKVEFVEMTGFRGFREKTRIVLPPGFAVLNGHNGTGKSTVLDAIDYALTGTINKFSVKGAKGGGLDEHIWWIGSGKAPAHYVSVGFVNSSEERFVVTRSRESGCTMQPSEIIGRLCPHRSAGTASVESLLQTTLIRDEWIAGLSLDLPEQARFSLVREAIGNLVGPDFSERTSAISNAAEAAKTRQELRIKDVQSELGRALGDLTEARSLAERSADISEALKVIEALPVLLPASPAERVGAVRRVIADRRLALQTMERMRAQLREIEKENTFFASEDAREMIETAKTERESAAEKKKLAEERLASAMKLDEAERRAIILLPTSRPSWSMVRLSVCRRGIAPSAMPRARNRSL